MKLRKISLLLSLFFSLLSPVFASPISKQEWTFSKGVVQGDSEWLSLTRAHESYTTANIQSKKTYKPTDTIEFEFDYISWGGQHAGGEGGDGMALYLFDTNRGGAGLGGYHSSALGYCRVNGGYIGIGLDEYGNFSSSCEKQRTDGAGVLGVTIRGSDTRGFAFKESFPIRTPLDCAKCKTREEAINAGGVKHLVAKLTPKTAGPGYTVDLSINGEGVIRGADYPYRAPASMKIGLSASNGGQTNHHEIRNLRMLGAGEEPPMGDQNLATGGSATLTGYGGQYPYPVLNDGNRAHKGWDGRGAWSVDPTVGGYGVDFKKPVMINKVDVYSRQDDGKEQQEPADSAIFVQYGAVDYDLNLYTNTSLPPKTIEVRNNHKVKQTHSFPPMLLARIEVIVHTAAGGRGTPAIAEMAAYSDK